MPRLVRRPPLTERILAAVNPQDILLRISEEIETRDLDSAANGTYLGIGANVVFALLRANSRPSQNVDDVFGDSPSGGWMSYLVSLSS